ncbi:M23 family metallopeptidase [Luethyella okanaganae]|uniref:M23 family metallopeptidase n=1 Tax=Luethyella okanaganae TaxID=69372 RepID=A0ABW1VEW6_9MICO
MTLANARSAYGLAKQAYDSAKSEYDATAATAARLDALALEAKTVADGSTRLLLRSLRPGGGTPGSLDVLFGGNSDGRLLDQLGAADRLAEVSGDLEGLARRANRDSERATTLRAQADAAHAATADIPLDERRSAMDAAKAAVDTATAELSALQPSVVAAIEVRPLPVVPSDTGQLSDQNWALPTAGAVTDGFGPRPARPAGAGPFHYGADISSGCNAWIRAASSGTVVEAGPNGGLGNWVLIDHGAGVKTGYAHIVDGGIVVSVGDTVTAGAPIALTGSTGTSTGCHLHFEVRINGARVDPEPFMLARGIVLGG